MSYILGGVEEEPIGDAADLEAIADEVEAGRGPVAFVCPGRRPVVPVPRHRRRVTDAGGRWRLDVRPRAQRQLSRLPEKIAAAAAEFIAGPLLVPCSWQMTFQLTLTGGEISSLSAGSASRWPRMVATALKLTLPTL